MSATLSTLPPSTIEPSPIRRSSPRPAHRLKAVVTSAASQIHITRTGHGEPLLLLHGLGESSVGWRPVMSDLSARYEVIAIDLPGFGRSAALPSGVLPTAANLAVAVEEALDRIGIGTYHVAGYSLGARVAIQLAKSSRVRSVIAIAPDGLGTPTERIQGFIALVAGRGVAMALSPAAGMLSMTPVGRSVFFAGSRSLPWQLTAADARQLLSDYAESPAYEAANWVSMFDMPTHLSAITAPTLLLQGTADPLMPQQISRYLALIPGAQLTWLPGLNHVPISDDPKTIAQLMLTFLGGARGVEPAA
jgi:pimeloyl-ACP methyl ester carboxylesterase